MTFYHKVLRHMSEIIPMDWPEESLKADEEQTLIQLLYQANTAQIQIKEYGKLIYLLIRSSDPQQKFIDFKQTLISAKIEGPPFITDILKKEVQELIAAIEKKRQLNLSNGRKSNERQEKTTEKYIQTKQEIKLCIGRVIFFYNELQKLGVNSTFTAKQVNEAMLVGEQFNDELVFINYMLSYLKYNTQISKQSYKVEAKEASLESIQDASLKLKSKDAQRHKDYFQYKIKHKKQLQDDPRLNEFQKKRLNNILSLQFHRFKP